MKTSNPPSYDQIFAIKVAGTDTIAKTVTLPNHRALLITASATNTAFTFTNLDNTTVSMTFVAGSLILPLQIKSYTYTTTQTTVWIYGLL